jgi:hypothetical protein
LRRADPRASIIFATFKEAINSTTADMDNISTATTVN